MLTQNLIKHTVSALTVDIGFHKNLALVFSAVGIFESLVSLVLEIKDMITQADSGAPPQTLAHDLM